MNSSSQYTCNTCGWQGQAEMTLWMIENEEDSTTYVSKCPICLSTDICEVTDGSVPDEYEVTERFNSILSKLEDIDTTEARDLEINVKLLQDKVRDKYFRMDERRQKRTRKKK